jgi:hypothetical protein
MTAKLGRDLRSSATPGILTQMTLPLQRLKVLDLSQIMAGPFCCMLLGDMGADVIKIEQPGTGDQTRRSMGFRLKGEDSGGFLALNRNKRSIELNLKNETGRKAFYDLVLQADIVVENYRPGVAKRLKIDYATLKDDQSRDCLCEHFGLRTDRSVVLASRPRFDRASNVRRHECNWISRLTAGEVQRADRRPRIGAACALCDPQRGNWTRHYQGRTIYRRVPVRNFARAFDLGNRGILGHRGGADPDWQRQPDERTLSGRAFVQRLSGHRRSEPETVDEPLCRDRPARSRGGSAIHNQRRPTS